MLVLTSWLPKLSRYRQIFAEDIMILGSLISQPMVSLVTDFMPGTDAAHSTYTQLVIAVLVR